MARIQRVVIRRFKRLEEVTLDLDDTTLLVGANNAGKSSILQAIHFAVSIAQSARLVGEGLAWARDAFQLSFNPAQLIYSPVADVMSLASGGALQEAQASQIEIEFHRSDGQTCIVGLRRGRNRNIGVKISGRVLGEALMDIAHPFTVYAPGLAGVPKEERYMSPGAVRRIVARGDANLVLRNVLRMLALDRERWGQFIDDLATLFPGIAVRIEFNEETDEDVQAFFSLGGGPELPVDAAGTSILQASQILAYTGLFRPRLLILDEPDSHLHPDNQRTLCSLLQKVVVERDFQGLVCTHSRHVVDALRDSARVVWLSKGSIVADADVNTTSMLLELGALDSVDYFADGTALRVVVATEDGDTQPLKALLWSNGFIEDDTEVASYAGCSKLEAAVVLGGFIRERAPHLMLVIHRDRDYLTDARVDEIERGLTACGVMPFITGPSDVEGYFLNARHLSVVNPGLSEARAQELIDAATAEGRDKSLVAMVNARTNEAFHVRRQGGDPPNHGQIAVQADRDLTANPAHYRRGKTVVGRLIALIQRELGVNPRVFVPSDHLQVLTLREVADRVWPGRRAREAAPR